MALGVAVNTPNYLWKRVAGQLGLRIMAEKRTVCYFLKVAMMSVDRLPKICLKDITNGINKRAPSEWGKKIQRVLNGFGAGNRLNDLERGENLGEICGELGAGIRWELRWEEEEEEVEIFIKKLRDLKGPITQILRTWRIFKGGKRKFG